MQHAPTKISNNNPINCKFDHTSFTTSRNPCEKASHRVICELNPEHTIFEASRNLCDEFRRRGIYKLNF
ncbi:hypothetical protein BGX23_004829 [Mortierella sp. AD031]|nr:hypothetical protein BGX23_004829 [Mortierella sp. AD031]KAG0209392.1 hypothetical protein BGX33_005550 [Mortierella sp. NVP41]